MSKIAPPSSAALEQADALCVELKPFLAEMLDRNHPSVKNLTFNDIESNSAAVGDLLSKLLMRRALAQQPAITAEEELAARQAVLRKVPRKKKISPEALQMTHIKQRHRKLKTARGEITFKRDYLYFPELETGIFPLEVRLGLPIEALTPRVQQQLLERVAVDDYRASAQSLKVLGNTISHPTAGRVLKQVGAQLHTELFGPEAEVKAAQSASSNAPSLLILSSDGSRYRTQEADRRKSGKAVEKAKELPAQDELDTEILLAAERDRGWRENKIGIVARAMHGHYDEKGRYLPPQELVKTYVATVFDIQVFGRLFRTEAERRGLEKAMEIIWVGDHGHGNPAMLKREFGALKNFVQIITDFYHCSERLSACAKALHGEGKTGKRQRQKLYYQLRNWLWAGEVEKVIRKLRSAAEALTPQPTSLTELEAQPIAKTLWQHVLYFEKYKGTMDYAIYRARGWPMGSGTIESACGQFGERVKHNRMRWTREGAEALHAIKAAIYSQDERWSRRWPPPIPILEMPLAA